MIGRSVTSALVCTLFVGCGSIPSNWIPKSSSEPRIEDLGSGVMKMTLRSGVLVQRTTELQARVEHDALAYCASRTGAIAVLESVRNNPEPPAYPSASVTFRCVAA